MIAHYYTLRAVASDLRHRLDGGRLVEAFSQNRNEIVLLFHNDLDESDEPTAVVISCEPSANAIYARDAYARARRNSVDFFAPIAGEHLSNVSISESDREISFAFTSGRVIIAQFFGSKANVLLCDGERVVLEPFLKTIASESHLPAPKSTAEAFERGAFMHLFHNTFEQTPLRLFCKSAFPRFGNVLIREALFRSAFDPERTVGEVSDRDAEALHAVCLRIREQLTAEPTPRIAFDGTIPVEFSIIPLEQYAELREELFTDIHAAIRTFIGSAHRQRQGADERKAVEQALRRELEQAERTLGKILSESVSPETASLYELYGKLLMANIHELSKGMKEAIVENVFSPSRDLLSIPMDVHLSPAKNAERYFERSKKTRITIEEQTERRTLLQKETETFRALLEELDEIENRDDLQVFIRRHDSVLARAGYRTQKTAAAPPPPPFRIFHVAGGFQVWAGKSSENNDLLTTRHTRKDDLWFHARGVGGSHVVLKVHTGKGEVSKLAIQQAASVAAFYSKMKKAGLVPVTMCTGKYVRKPKGAPVGTVTVEREETIFAEPTLPTE